MRAQLEEQARAVAARAGRGGRRGAGALAAAERALGQLERIDPATAAWRELLDGAYAKLTELARLAADYADEVQEDPARLEEVERRRDLLFRLQQKYGGDAWSGAGRPGWSAAAELDLLDTADARPARARRERAVGGGRAAAPRRRLTEKRTDAASRLARGVSRLLPQAGPARRQVRRRAWPRCSEPGRAGPRRCVIHGPAQRGARAPGRSPKAASGGELSRLMLALKVVLARHDAVATLVFDEVDQGIGGEVGRAGRRRRSPRWRSGTRCW